ncbi:avidin-related protein 1-like [Protobothrops mucrosquamatus]|uniref:avidin-related protein 1-like n=1 Tax=Protobothrops mucrosquamatus TaxID=103944 RepID=UPI000775E0BE|nr:avidin-related protein 1-like [Protobothrops mucrosquamatus]
MAIGLAALGLLAFLLGCSGTFAEPQNSESRVKCSLTGIWESDIGIRMKIYNVSDIGEFSGFFYIIRRPNTRIFIPFPLQGIQHQGRQPTFGFTVSGELEGPTAAVFVGQCLVDENGKEQLRTTWVFRKHVESAAKDWGATRVERSTFYRIK